MPFYSMTGFGRGQARGAGLVVTCEIKSVNNRFLDVNIRLPRTHWSMEARIKERIGQSVQRGRVDVFLAVDHPRGQNEPVQFDMDLAARYIKSIHKLQNKLGLTDTVSTADVLRLEGVVHAVEAEADVEEHWPVIEKALDTAIGRLLEMRKREGRNLKMELTRLHADLSAVASAMTAEAGEVNRQLTERLRDRITQLAGTPGVEPARLNQEIAILMSKADVTEEIARLAGHLKEWKSTLGQDSPVGKRMDFLVQEIHREITTFGNKVQGSAISKLVVEAKTTAEKLKEQIQNIE